MKTEYQGEQCMTNISGTSNSAPLENDFGKLVSSWMESAQTFWQAMGLQKEDTMKGAGFNFNFGAGEEKANENKYKTYKTWETSVNNYTSLLKLMMTPENRDNLAKGAMTFSEGLVEMTGETLENFAEFQSQLVKSFTKAGEHTKAFNFDDLDRSTFEAFRELYRTEFQKYLYVPKVGLNREYNEQCSELIDKSNIFSSYLIELLYLFSVPFEKTNWVMQQKIKKMLETGEVVEDSKQAYNDWIKILEGHFMELLKSREYTEVLNNTITSLAAYKGVKNDVTDIFLKEFQIPTRKDMDEVYKDIYLMKKKIRTLSRQVESLQSELKELKETEPVAPRLVANQGGKK